MPLCLPRGVSYTETSRAQQPQEDAHPDFGTSATELSPGQAFKLAVASLHGLSLSEAENMCSPPRLGAVYPTVCYKVKSAGGKDMPWVVYKVKRPPSRAEAALPPTVSELPHGASVHQGPARLPVSKGMCTHHHNHNHNPDPNPNPGTEPDPNSGP